MGDGEVSLGNLLTHAPCSRPTSCGPDLLLPATGVGALLWPLTHRLEGVTLMGVLVEEEVVAGSISGHPRGQLDHIRGLCVHQLDCLPFQVQLLPRCRGRCEGTRCGRSRPILPNNNSQNAMHWQQELGWSLLLIDPEDSWKLLLTGQSSLYSSVQTLEGAGLSGLANYHCLYRAESLAPGPSTVKKCLALLC